VTTNAQGITMKAYQYTDGMLVDLEIVRAHGMMGAAKKDDYGGKIDLWVAEKFAVTGVPVDFLNAAVRSEQAYVLSISQAAPPAPDAPKGRLDAARRIVGLWVRPLLAKYAESTGAAVAPNEAPPKPKLADLIPFDCRRQLARDAREGAKPPVLAADWLLFVRRLELERTPPYAPKYPQREVSLRELLDRFEPGSPVTAENADSVAEELLMARALGIGGYYKTLDATRHTLQALLLEAVGSEIGDPGDEEFAKAATAIKKLEETKASFRKQWDQAAKQAPAAVPAKAVAPAAKK
jgi:hypothetical protein